MQNQTVLPSLDSGIIYVVQIKTGILITFVYINVMVFQQSSLHSGVKDNHILFANTFGSFVILLDDGVAMNEKQANTFYIPFGVHGPIRNI